MAEIYNPGYDVSGNENDWTPTNINYTTSTATTYDRMSDVPTLTDEDTGNFATLNAINKPSSHTLSNGNLTTAITSIGGIDSTIGVSSGKWYCEVTLNTVGADTQLGVTNITGGYVSAYLGQYTTSWGCITFNGNRIHNGSQSSYGSSFSNGDVGMIALDMDTGKWYCGKNGTWFNSGNPVNGTNPAHTGLTGVMKFAIGSNSSSGNHSINFGQRPFAYTPPTGYKKLNTYNLPDSTIVDGSQYMNTLTWIGDGTSSRSITGLGFQPDLVWWKNRTTAKWHQLFDSVRGADKALSSNATDAEDAAGGYGGEGSVTSFDSDGFTLQGGVGNNESSSGIVGWSWRGSDSTAVTNTDGTITSTVSANTTSGFSVVTYTGTGAVATVGHGLGVAPSMVIVKNRDAVSDWRVWHSGLSGSNYYVSLNLTNAEATSTGLFGTHTSSIISLQSGSTVNGSGNGMVAYCFAEVEGFSKFGSYTGNGSADGPFVYTGFRPAFVLIKASSFSGSYWCIYDTARETYNVIDSLLFPNANIAESTDPLYNLDILSNGFKVRANNNSHNTSGATYIYMAFASNPFKNSLAR